MKLLLVPMTAMAETAGPFSRARTLAECFLARGWEVTLCAGEDGNARSIPGVSWVPLTVPSPLGLPKAIGSRMFPLAVRLGLPGHRTVHSLEEVLYFTGATAESSFHRSVAEVRAAIQAERPTLVYAEFHLAAIAAAKAEGVPVWTSYSAPAQPSFAASPQYAGGVNRVLAELGAEPVHSVLDLLLRADRRLVPSCPELEPMDAPDTVFTGPFSPFPPLAEEVPRTLALAYFGSGVIARSRLLRELPQAFADSPLELYLAGQGLPTVNKGRLHIAGRFDFEALLPRAAVFLHHGGQNSLMDALRFQVPQLIFPGHVFERQYNADCMTRNGAGLSLPLSAFRASSLAEAVETLRREPSYGQNALRLRELLSALGGADRIADCAGSAQVEACKKSH